jgi:hypothetical protein
MNNFFSSVQTFKYLHNKEMNVFGTIRVNRIASEL